MSLLVMGTVALDDIETSKQARKNLLGGSGAHCAMSASLFTQVHLVGIVGEDFPKRHIALLRSKGVDLSSVEISQGRTFHWSGAYDAKDWNTAVTKQTELGVLEGYAPRITEAQKRLPYVFLANNTPDLQKAVLDQVRSPKLVGLDSMNLWITHMRKPLLGLLKRVDLFVANDREAQMLTGEQNLFSAARALRKMGPRLIVVKKGEHGVIFFCDEFCFSFPAFPVMRVLDPTGAGDTFAGGLMGYLAKTGRLTRANLKRACLYATVCASFNVEGFGPSRTAILSVKDVEARLKEFLVFIQPE
ncbi:MAG TPA: PfkB family carbohydrate kinase [Candidatus Omnitrophota bacterium]|nr:PfkB family carbohydrate kinase [Candidatus Omnitrophota bacterium]HSA31839.1 PfkB family carbohydrate kinase [Candidatus Omnitrophota bacterium]